MQHATLCYVFDGDEVLLIRQRRGIGEGKINGPGGKVEGNETPEDCAIREVREEVGIEIPEDAIEKRGELRFTFGDDPFQHVHVFATTEYKGEPETTDEAVPEWVHIDDMPYDQMWPDDEYWMPLLFDGETFKGEFLFDEDGEEILDYDLDTVTG